MKRLTRYIAGCGRNIWAYPPISDPDYLHRVGLREAIKRAATELPRGGVVADLGCGWMPYKEWFDTDGRTYIPLDVTGYPDRRFRLIRDEKLPLSSEAVDMLVCWQVLEHVHDMESFFREVKRVLKPGAPAFFTTHGLFRIHDKEDFWRWTPAGLELLFQNQRFDGIRVERCDSTYSIVASLVNNAWKPDGKSALSQLAHRIFSASVNSLAMAADFLSRTFGLAGALREASTYVIEVRRPHGESPASQEKTSFSEYTPGLVSVCVAVCTRNRSDDLQRLLPKLDELDYPRELLEVIVVDNGSSDETEQIAMKWCASRPNAKYVNENRPGLPFARNCAWRNTDAELVAYIDDDAVPDRRWLQSLAEAYHRESLRGQCHLALGGRAFLEMPVGAPATDDWLGDDMLGWLSALDYGPDTFVLDKPHMHLVGANFAVPKKTLEAIGGFSEEVHGTYGDERGVEHKIRANGGRLVYVGGARVRHHVSTDRLTRSWFRKRLLAEGRTVARLGAVRATDGGTSTLKLVFSGAKSFGVGVHGCLLQGLTPSPDSFSQSCRFWFACGLLGEVLRATLRTGSRSSVP